MSVFEFLCYWWCQPVNPLAGFLLASWGKALRGPQPAAAHLRLPTDPHLPLRVNPWIESSLIARSERIHIIYNLSDDYSQAGGPGGMGG